MSKKTQQLIEQLKDNLPGLSMSKFLSDVGAELKNQAAHGSHEMAAALFNGNAFVMYPRTGNDSVENSPTHGLAQEAAKAPEMEQERGGHEM